MFRLLGKSTVLTATIMLLLQTVCLAEAFSCSCSQADTSMSACQCCCGDPTQAANLGCPHCHQDVARKSCDGTDSVSADSSCHCQLSVPPSEVSLFNLESTDAATTALPFFDACTPSFMVVCQASPSRPASTNLPLPDTSFRRIVLCVWLT